ncbi:cysteine hydrolase family protein [Tropicimonas marinistellae]|uniref:cysteine hydrolase family protein n=1 Tax=Tropicimonas marinistellae TaxID=1739787 RepID=UPI0008378FF0|nr:isochorismatase family cysteine hydrolase [Tropicimonas marinistellae]
MISRDVPLHIPESALLVIDMQNYTASETGGAYSSLSEADRADRFGWFFRELDRQVIPNIQQLQTGFRNAGIEVLFTTIESLTRDGRDRGLDYKTLGYNVPKGSWDGRVIDALAPDDDEIVLPKSSSSVFISTNIDYVLRSLGVRQLVVCGMETDDCVESAIRDAADLGYHVTQVTDACATYSAERHAAALDTISGHCRQILTRDLLSELEASVGTWA